MGKEFPGFKGGIQVRRRASDDVGVHEEAGEGVKEKDEKKQYLIFKTKAFCEEERETQMANSEE
ncbi:hypothetical protein [Archangium lansingense]|uniref:Uncharacterized protein n=1 Tax=Archangium lansingense TaxID=2995310 RepID=A0ABT4AAR6_9BACT|nr:hypothetical protein [Archangium lansinium]MCY1078768.1 hypothetical protein [Archangium lansinium]